MSDVKRYTVQGRDWQPKEDESGTFVLAAEYDALLAVNERIRIDLLNAETRLTGMTFDRNCRMQERDQLRAELAAIRGQEPMAWVQKCPPVIHQPCKPHYDHANGYTVPLYSLPPQQPDAVSVPSEWIDAVRFAEAMLTNLQPHIVQACYPGRARFLDNYVDPVLDKFRALLSTRQAEEGE